MTGAPRRSRSTRVTYVLVLCASLASTALAQPQRASGPAVATGASDASAPVRVLLGPMQGRVSELQSVVQSAFASHGGEFELLATSEYGAAASRAGVDALSTGRRELAQISDAARVDVVLVGSLTARPRRGFTLTLTVYRGGDGERVGATTQELQSLGELALSSESIYGALQRSMREARAARPPLPALPLPAPEPSSAPAPSAAPSAPPVAPSASPQAGATAASGPDETAVLGAVRIRVGGSLSQRYWRMAVLGEVTPRGYDNAGFPEVFGDVSALYRLGGRRFGLGAIAGVALPVAVASRGYDDAGQPVQLNTFAMDLWGGLAFAYRPPRGGEFRGSLGGVFHTFNVDTTPLAREQRLAPVTYLGGRGSLEGALAMYARRGVELQLTFATELRLTVPGREIAQAFGESTALAVGIGGAAGFVLRLDRWAPGLSLGASASVLRYRTSFTGRTDVGTGSDSVDDYLRFGAFVSYDVLTPRIGP